MGNQMRVHGQVNGSLQAIFTLCLFCFFPKPGIAQTHSPNQTFDLSAYGYAAPVDEVHARAYSILHEAVTFLDPHTVAISFYARNTHAGLSTREGVAGSPYLFKTVILDLVHPEAPKEKAWGNAAYANALLALEDGRFFVQEGVHGSIFTRDLQLIVSKNVDVPGDIPARFSASPTGRTLIEFQDAWDAKHFTFVTKAELLDTHTLSSNRVRLSVGHADDSVSDRQIAYTIGQDRVSPRLFFDTFEHPASKRGSGLLGPVKGTVQVLGCDSPVFVRDDLLAVGGHCPSLLLITPIRPLKPGIVRHEYPHAMVGGDIRPAPGGNFFAFTVSYLAGSKLHDVSLSVFDVAANRVCWSIDLEPLPQHKLAFGFSPDGSLLAVEIDHQVSIYAPCRQTSDEQFPSLN